MGCAAAGRAGDGYIGDFGFEIMAAIFAMDLADHSLLVVLGIKYATFYRCRD